MKNLVVIGAGGAIGAVARHLLGALVVRHVNWGFPLSTFLVNLSGCLVIGILYGIATRYTWLSLEWRLFLITGICGGYTTFSSFSFESINLIRQGSYIYFFLYVFGSVILGLLATVVGIIVTSGV